VKKLLLFLLILVFTNSVNAFNKTEGGDCINCHKITKEEATKILNQIDPNITVEKVSYSPVGGIYQLYVKDKKLNIGVVYLDFKKKHLIIGNVIDIHAKKSLTEEAIEDNRVIDVKKIPIKDALIWGNRNGTKKLYVFTDPECPYCYKLHTELEKLLKEEPQLVVYLIVFGLDRHPDAFWKTNSIVCKSKENMEEALKLLEMSYQGKEVPKINCDKNYAEANKKIANNFDVSKTPTIILPNGKVISGWRTKEDLKKLINSK